MGEGDHRLQILALLMIGLVACSSLPMGRELPLVDFGCLQVFPHGYEIHATLGVAPAKQEFLLALRSEPQQFDFALLTAQGMPVYSLSCAVGGTRVSSQTLVSDNLPPQLLLTYFAIIFMDAGALSEQLQPGWKVHEDTGARRLTGPGVVDEIQVRYEGPAPWFGTIELEDSLNAVTLRMVILESSRVLPE